MWRVRSARLFDPTLPLIYFFCLFLAADEGHVRWWRHHARIDFHKHGVVSRADTGEKDRRVILKETEKIELFTCSRRTKRSPEAGSQHINQKTWDNEHTHSGEVLILAPLKQAIENLNATLWSNIEWVHDRKEIFPCRLSRGNEDQYSPLYLVPYVLYLNH